MSRVVLVRAGLTRRTRPDHAYVVEVEQGCPGTERGPVSVLPHSICLNWISDTPHSR